MPNALATPLPFSLTGYPSVVVRVGTAGNGMPIGVQIVARPWREDLALAIASILERSLGGWIGTSAGEVDGKSLGHR